MNSVDPAPSPPIAGTCCQPRPGPRSPVADQWHPDAGEGVGHAASTQQKGTGSNAGYFPDYSIDYNDRLKQGAKRAAGMAASEAVGLLLTLSCCSSCCWLNA